MSRRVEPNARGQLALISAENCVQAPRYGHEHTADVQRSRYRYEHTTEELAAYERTRATLYRIRPDWLDPDERLCPGCGKVIPVQARTCGRRWCDAVRPVWGRRVGEIVRAALVAYCELMGGSGRVLATVITCTSKPGWWDTDTCGHPADGSRCSGPAGCRVRPEVEERERRLFPARSRAAKKMARTEALRKLRRAGYTVRTEQAKRLGVLMSVVEDQQRGVPHEHIVCPHTSALEVAFTRAFFDALPRAARHHELGYVDHYRYVVARQGRHEAQKFHGYLGKLARYLAKSSSAGEFLQKHHGERVYYVAPWLTELSGVTMTVARICGRVWAARHGYCEPPTVPSRLLPVIERLVGPLVAAPAAP
jgi:hypothetical protein